MPLDRVTSTDEFVRLYKTGELLASISLYNKFTGGKNDEQFVSRCVTLHNSGEIDLLSLPSQPDFSSLEGIKFLNAQYFYCEAIPRLYADAAAIMEFCRILAEKTKAGTAPLVEEAFRKWCLSNPDKCPVIVVEARAENQLARRFVVFALLGSNDVTSAIDFVQMYSDDRRLSAMRALSEMNFIDGAAAHGAIAVLEPFVGESGDDDVRDTALRAAFGILKKHSSGAIAGRLVDAAAREPGPKTLQGLAYVAGFSHGLLDDGALRKALSALETMDSAQVGAANTIDMLIWQLLGKQGEVAALDFLTTRLQDAKLTIGDLDTTAHELRHGNPQRLYELVVRWLLGNATLCVNARELVGFGEVQAFDVIAQPLGLTPEQQIFLCRKAIGYLFITPVICCSIIVSVLRGCNADVEAALTSLLFDPILTNYSDDTREYLKSVPAGDPAYGPIQAALARDAAYSAALEAIGPIKELQPSDYERDVVRQREYDKMCEYMEEARDTSIFGDSIHRVTVLYGKRTLAYVAERDGSLRAVESELAPFGTSIELPHREVLDPVMLDFMLNVFRAEKLP